MSAIFKREFFSYIKSPIAYVFAGFLILLASFFFVLGNLGGRDASLYGLFMNLTVIFILVIPILTMRTFAEEKNKKTDQLLLCAPVKVSSIVLGKFFAAFVIFVITMLVPMLFVPIMQQYGNPPVSEIMAGFLGIFLLGALFISIGIFMSTLTESQVVAAVTTFGVLLLLWLMSSFTTQISNIFIDSAPWLSTAIKETLNFLSITSRFIEFGQGIVNLVPIFYFVSLSFLFLFLSAQVIERRRWK